MHRQRFLRIAAFLAPLLAPVTLHADVTGRIQCWVTPGVIPDNYIPAGSTTELNPEAVVNMPAIDVEWSTSPGVGGTVTTRNNGTFTIAGASLPVHIRVQMRGPYARVVNHGGPDLVEEFDLGSPQTPGTTVVLNSARTEFTTAQANAFYYINKVAQWIWSVDPNDLTPTRQIVARVNLGAGSGCTVGCDSRLERQSPCDPSHGAEILFAAASGSSTFSCQAGGGCHQPSAPCLGCSNDSGICSNKASQTCIVHEVGHWLSWTYWNGYDPSSADARGLDEAVADVWTMFVSGQPVFSPYPCGSYTCARSGENTVQFPVTTGGQYQIELPLMGAFWKMRAGLIDADPVYGAGIAAKLFLTWVQTYPQPSTAVISPSIRAELLSLDQGLFGVGDPLISPPPHAEQINAAFDAHHL